MTGYTNLLFRFI